MSVLVILEQQGGEWHKASWEALAAGAELARGLGRPVEVAVAGAGIDGLCAEAAGYKVERVLAVDHALLAEYTPDGFTTALAQVVRERKPYLVVMPHTYQVREFAPKLAASLDRVMVSDVVAARVEGGALILVRQLFQGKMNADVAVGGEPPYFVSVQAGAFRADQLEKGSCGAPVEKAQVKLEPGQIRTRPLERFQEAKRTVDLSSAEIIVAVGRGIKDPENLPMAEKLAQALGGELGASRPICDNGWLPMERQIGSSGQTVSPKLYLAVGISGAIQHLVGMKGSRTVVAINKDANAPIFEIADYGIVGNLFDVVPALTEEVLKNK